MRIHWFSPLPPARTGIADYTREVLPALARRATVTLWTTDEKVDPALAEFGEIRHYRHDLSDLHWRDLNRGDACVYQLGNNWRFHSGAWRVSQQHPGLVVLHDWSLLNFFFLHFHELEGNPGGFDRVLERYHGPDARELAHRWRAQGLDDDARERFPLTGLAVNNASGVLVHTPAALAGVRELTPAPLRHAPLPFSARPSSDEPRPTHRDGPVRLIVFGHLGGNRRLESTLTALASLEEREQFRLDVVGSVADEARVRRQIAQLGLGRLVRLHGYVEESALDAALGQADLAINLRFPTMGEASGSQLRIWNHALPSVVTRTGWYASLPPSTVSFVEPETELIDLQRHLRAYLADPAPFVAQGLAGRAKLAEHAPDRYVDTLLELAQAAQQGVPDAARLILEERVAQALPELGVDPQTWGERIFAPRPKATSPLSGRLEALRAELSQAADHCAQTLDAAARAKR